MQRYLALLERATIQVLTDNVQFHVIWIDREKSILLSQEFHFILGVEQTPDFLPCPRVTQSNAIPSDSGKPLTNWHCHSMEHSPMAPTLELTHAQGRVCRWEQLQGAYSWVWVTRFHTVPVRNPKFIWKHSISSSTKYCLHAGWEAGRWWHFTLQLAREYPDCHAAA